MPPKTKYIPPRENDLKKTSDPTKNALTAIAIVLSIVSIFGIIYFFIEFGPYIF